MVPEPAAERAARGARPLDADASRAPLWDAADALCFRDADGVAWRVVECEARHVPGACGDRCLVFLSENVVRRVWDFPRDWRTMPPQALDALTLRRAADRAPLT